MSMVNSTTIEEAVQWRWTARHPLCGQPAMCCGVTALFASDSYLPHPGERSRQVFSHWVPKWGRSGTLLGPHSQGLVLRVLLDQWTPMVTLFFIFC
jgi:hypothetical protein